MDAGDQAGHAAALKYRRARWPGPSIMSLRGSISRVEMHVQAVGEQQRGGRCLRDVGLVDFGLN